jgi:hypothetical protein
MKPKKPFNNPGRRKGQLTLSNGMRDQLDIFPLSPDDVQEAISDPKLPLLDIRLLPTLTFNAAKAENSIVVGLSLINSDLAKLEYLAVAARELLCHVRDMHASTIAPESHPQYEALMKATLQLVLNVSQGFPYCFIGKCSPECGGTCLVVETSGYISNDQQ